MVEVGVRNLKARLSYYLQLAEAGEVIAVKVRERIVGWLSNLRPVKTRSTANARSKHDDDRAFEKMRREGLILSGGRYHHRTIKRGKIRGSATMAEVIRQIRDEGY